MKLRSNVPHHAPGLMARPREKAPVTAGTDKPRRPMSAAPKASVRGSPESHMASAGRGGTGRIGKGDNYKGKPTNYTDEISHSAFEKLGAG